jgi:hypothetical protein
MKFDRIMKEAVVLDKTNQYDKLGFYYPGGRPTHVSENLIQHGVKFFMDPRATGENRLMSIYSFDETVYHPDEKRRFKPENNYTQVKGSKTHLKMSIATLYKHLVSTKDEDRLKLLHHILNVAREDGADLDEVPHPINRLSRAAEFLMKENKPYFFMRIWKIPLKKDRIEFEDTITDKMKSWKKWIDLP